MTSAFVTWSDREPPLIACAVAAWANVAQRLAHRLLELDDVALGRLAGVSGKNTLVLLGDEADLPWVDGVLYLGRDPDAPSLLLPTRMQPAVPSADVLERAVKNNFANIPPPIAVLPETRTVISCHQALRLARHRIEALVAVGNR